jgi:hypothetical protein
MFGRLDETFNIILQSSFGDPPTFVEVVRKVIYVELHHCYSKDININKTDSFLTLRILILFLNLRLVSKQTSLSMFRVELASKGFEMITFSVDKGVSRRNEARRRKAGLRVSSLGSSEEKDVGLWFMHFVVSPSSRLLDTG